jgi:hypothetical protein
VAPHQPSVLALVLPVRLKRLARRKQGTGLAPDVVVTFLGWIDGDTRQAFELMGLVAQQLSAALVAAIENAVSRVDNTHGGIVENRPVGKQFVLVVCVAGLVHACTPAPPRGAMRP